MIASCHKIAVESVVVGPSLECPWLYAWPCWDQKLVLALLIQLLLAHRHELERIDEMKCSHHELVLDDLEEGLSQL